MLRRARTFILLFLIAAVGVTALPACSTGEPNQLTMMIMAEMPAEVQSAPQVVQQAYQFAAANPEIMKQIPCYCGCGSIGHSSNYSCYIADEKTDGTLKFDNHALGCSICVDITQDAMRLSQQGNAPPDIRAYIDDAYGKYGTSNMPGGAR